MELEFDKEIDAILRKARLPEGGGASAANGSHLDADTIAAFAENALPQKTKLLYMEHLADCDRCRGQFSRAIRMNTEADTSDPGTASVIAAPVTEASIPWYQKLFKTQNLALATGALVLTFSAVLGYLVLQNSKQAENATVSQVTEEETGRGGPFFAGDAATANSNAPAAPASQANTAAAAANVPAANSIATGAGTASNAATGELGRLDSAEEKPVPMDDKNVTQREVTGLPQVPPAPTITTDGVSVERFEKKLDADKAKKESERADEGKRVAEKDVTLAARKQSEDRRGRDAPPPPAKSGPTRSGPLQNQSNQINSNIYDMSVRRMVGGKAFDNRDGAWYDSTYRGQATVNFRRGTDEYKKLDKGIRNIADTLGGTVVVVWKEKAYRIQ